MRYGCQDKLPVFSCAVMKTSLEANQIILKDKSLKTGLLNFRDAFTNESWVCKIRLATQVAVCVHGKVMRQLSISGGGSQGEIRMVRASTFIYFPRVHPGRRQKNVMKYTVFCLCFLRWCYIYACLWFFLPNLPNWSWRNPILTINSSRTKREKFVEYETAEVQVSSFRLSCVFFPSSRPLDNIGSFSNDVSENVTIKMNSRFFPTSSQLFKQCRWNFLELNFLETSPKFKKRKNISSSCVYVLLKTSHQEISRPSRAVTAKKCTKKCNAREEYSYCFGLWSQLPFLRSRSRRRSSC